MLSIYSDGIGINVLVEQQDFVSVMANLTVNLAGLEDVVAVSSTLGAVGASSGSQFDLFRDFHQFLGRSW